MRGGIMSQPIIRLSDFRPFFAARILFPFLLLMTGGCGGGDTQSDTAMRIADVGFMTPESVLIDTLADVYIVSNINGEPAAEDDNGFISRVTPDGQVENLKWIDGASPDITLNAPKGMAIRGDTLFVTDLGCIRMFHRVTGAKEGETCIQGATFLNDIVLGMDTVLYVTDSGLKAGASGLEPSGTDAVYRMPLLPGKGGEGGTVLMRGPEMGRPNGLAAKPRGVVVVTFGSGEIFLLDSTGKMTSMMSPTQKQLDGVAFMPDGSLLFSSWVDSAIMKVPAVGGRYETVVSGAESPADFAFDAKRGRVVIPLFNRNEILIQEVR
jgi:hypothetical protein